MDRRADNLFEDSTMTFGEHLEELRRSLAKAAIWLGVGLAIGLVFADSLVQFIQVPLRQAIVEFYVDKTLAKMGFDPTDPAVKPDRKILLSRGLVREDVYVLEQEFPRGAADDEDQKPQQARPAADDRQLASAAGSNDRAAPANSPPENEPPARTAADKPAAEKPAADKPVAENPAETPPARDDALPIPKIEAEPFDLPSMGRLRPMSIFRTVDAGLNALKVEEPFMIWLKAGLVLGAVIGSPGIFYHLWTFVAAGLYPHERRYIHIYLPFSIVLFWSGVGIAFFFVLQFVLSFLLTFNAHLNVEAMPQLTYYVSFVLLLPLGFGIAFQLPLVMLFLQRIGLFETSAYIASWRVAILVIFVVAMLLTPADVYSMIGLAIPLTLLYFLGILLCKFMPRGAGIGSQGYDPQ